MKSGGPGPYHRADITEKPAHDVHKVVTIVKQSPPAHDRWVSGPWFCVKHPTVVSNPAPAERHGPDLIVIKKRLGFLHASKVASIGSHLNSEVPGLRSPHNLASLLHSQTQWLLAKDMVAGSKVSQGLRSMKGVRG